MNSGDPLIDEALKPLLEDDNNSTSADQEGGCDTSGFGVVSAEKHTSSSPTAPLAAVIPVLDTSTNEPTETTTTPTLDEPKYCRICGEGEEKQANDDYYDDRQHDDEEFLLDNPMIPTTTMTLQQPPGSGYPHMMTAYQNGSSFENANNDITTIIAAATAAMQHSHLEDPPIRPTAPITTTTTTSTSTSTKRHQCSNERKQMKNSMRRHNPLIRPCQCKGTMMYVHVSCLNQWRTLSPRASSYVACDLCGYEYNIYRPMYAAIVTNVHFLRLMTAFLVISFIVTCAYLVKTIDVYGLGHLPRPDDEIWLELHGPTWLWMDRFYLFAGLFTISVLGLVYLTYLCVTRPEEVTYLTNRYASSGDDDNGSGGLSFLCCDQTSCPWYSCYLADFAACSGDSAAGGLLIFVVLMSFLAILFGVFGAVTGIFRLMESWVDSIAGHIKERILDVD